MKLSDLICCYNDLSHKDCNLIIDWFKKNTHLHQEGRASATGSGSVVKWDHKVATQAYPERNDEISHFITSKIINAFQKYESEYPSPKGEPLGLRDLSVRVYPKEKGFFLEHFDQNALNVHRVFAIIIYLNDVEVGGSTTFPDLDVSIKPEEGKILIFPCNYLFSHEGEMPISNEKYIVTAFINFQDISRH